MIYEGLHVSEIAQTKDILEITSSCLYKGNTMCLPHILDVLFNDVGLPFIFSVQQLQQVLVLRDKKLQTQNVISNSPAN